MRHLDSLGGKLAIWCALHLGFTVLFLQSTGWRRDDLAAVAAIELAFGIAIVLCLAQELIACCVRGVVVRIAHRAGAPILVVGGVSGLLIGGLVSELALVTCAIPIFFLRDVAGPIGAALGSALFFVALPVAPVAGAATETLHHACELADARDVEAAPAA